MVSYSEIYDAYRSISVEVEGAEEMNTALSTYLENLADEIGVPAKKEFMDVAKSIVKERNMEINTDEDKLSVAFHTFLYELLNLDYFDGACDILLEDEDICRFKHNDKVLYEGTYKQLKEQYDYLIDK